MRRQGRPALRRPGRRGALPAQGAGERPSLSTAVVTIAHGRHDHLRGQLRSLARSERPPDLHVVVAMGDQELPDVVARAADPHGPTTTRVVPLESGGRLPLAAARNAGAREALALGADVLVFLDVDCLAGAGLTHGYAAAVHDEPDTVWSGPVTYLAPAGPEGYRLDALPTLDQPHPARPAPPPGTRLHDAEPDLFWSLSFALAAEAWRTVGGFHEGYEGYGAEDTDFGRLVVEAGLRLGWVGDARAYHQHHPTTLPPVQHLADILRNGRVFRDRWGGWPMQGWIDEFERRGLVQARGDDYVAVPGA